MSSRKARPYDRATINPGDKQSAFMALSKIDLFATGALAFFCPAFVVELARSGLSFAHVITEYNFYKVITTTVGSP